VGVSDVAQVTVEAPDSVKILSSEKSRLAEKIQKKIERPQARQCRQRRGQELRGCLHLSKYDKGNAFARAMLAGLGQIHINGKVDIYQMPDHTLVGEFDLNKTFAWGGIYGAATSMEDIEDTFADGVAATVHPDRKKPGRPSRRPEEPTVSGVGLPSTDVPVRLWAPGTGARGRRVICSPPRWPGAVLPPTEHPAGE